MFFTFETEAIAAPNQREFIIGMDLFINFAYMKRNIINRFSIRFQCHFQGS
jgi:hypothetical protein